jgi:hypothetical protein
MNKPTGKKRPTDKEGTKPTGKQTTNRQGTKPTGKEQIDRQAINQHVENQTNR